MSADPKPKPLNQSLKKEFMLFFGSVKLAIVLLLLIALASVIGTVLPQDQGPAVIDNSTFHPVAKQVLHALKAHDVYHAFWFNFLLALLFLNLAVCTYLRFPPTWRRYQMRTPPAPPVAALQEAVEVPGAPTQAQLDLLRKRGYHVAEIPNGEYFAEKGKFVRLAPTFIHISLFAVILGAIAGGVTGIKNSLPMMVGESIGSDEIFKTSYIKGSAAQPPSPFKIRLDAFRMDFRPNGMVKQYYSDITVIPEKGEPFTKQIWVNEPLIHNGQYFYQSFWGIGGLRYQVGNGEPTQLILQQAKSGGYLSKPFSIAGEDYIFFVREMETPALVVSVKTVTPVAQLMPGSVAVIGGQKVGLTDYQLFSGLETKKDPGIPLVYFGCGMMIFGLAMVGSSHREVWVRRTESGWVLAGRTHKGRIMLRKELQTVAGLWQPPSTESASHDIGAKAS
jgi:cytochrome c biogenesis protein